MRPSSYLLVLAFLASCTIAEPPLVGTGAVDLAIATPPPPFSTPDETGDPTVRLATLKIGVSRVMDVENLLGAPNETETDKVPCGNADAACMKTTVTWTYYQVKNGRSNALSSSQPVTLLFDRDGVLREIGGEWRAIVAAHQSKI